MQYKMMNRKINSEESSPTLLEPISFTNKEQQQHQHNSILNARQQNNSYNYYK